MGETVSWITPETLKAGGNLIIILLMLVGLYRLGLQLINVIGRPVAEAWVQTVLKISEAVAIITIQLQQLQTDHSEITQALRRLNGKSDDES